MSLLILEISLWRKGDIQLLRSHLGREGQSIKMQTYVNREEGGLCHFNRAPTNVWKAYPDLQKEKGLQNEQELWLKVKKGQEQYEKTLN